MRTKSLAALFLICGLAMGTSAIAELTQRAGAQGRRGQAGRVPQAAELEPQEVLENFDKIVEPIWTEEEEDAWDSARTDEERQAFIASFWESRDPTPDTEDNEFRDLYMGRAATAKQMFQGEGKEGYETARGQFFLIYGGNAIREQQVNRPQEGAIAGADNEDPMAAANRELSTGRGVTLIWFLDTSINPFLEGKDQVSFAQQYGSVYNRTTRGIELSQEAFLASRDVQDFFAARLADPNFEMVATGGGGLGRGGGTPGTSPITTAMQELMEEGISHQDLGLYYNESFVPAPGGNTFSIVTFEVDKQGLTFVGSQGVEAPAEMRAFGFIVDESGEAGPQVVHQINNEFVVRPNEGTSDSSRTRSFGITMPPGVYRLAWGVMDEGSQRLTTMSEPLEVPSFGTGELMLTSVFVFKPPMQRKTDPIEVGKLYDGVRIGSISLDVDIDNVFGRDDTLELLYFIMGVRADATTQEPEIEIDYRILEANTGTSIARLPTQTLNHAAIGQQIPLAQVEQIQPGGNYTLEIEIRDLVSGGEVKHEVPFKVASEEAVR
jgi:GWxTD domain-containing protein